MVNLSPVKIAEHDIGVCEWSLRASGIGGAARLVKSAGLSHIQLSLGPLLFLDDKRKHQELGDLRASGLTLTAGMIAFPDEDYSSIPRVFQTGGYLPDATWPVRKGLVTQAGKLAAELGIKCVSTHLGAIPPSSHEDYAKLLGRTGEVAETLAASGVMLLVETGPETASALLQFLNDLPTRNIGVNFDPANLILYGADDPIEAVRTLGRQIRHVHVKDAVASSQPGTTWGKEVPFGQGDVGAVAFLAALNEAGYTGPLVIERETGDDPLADIVAAVNALQDAEEELAKAV